MDYCFSFSDRMQKNSSFIILLLVSFVYHVYCSVSALYYTYCSVLSSSQHIFSCFIFLLIMLQDSIIVIRATSGIIRVQDAIIYLLLLLQLSCIISSCRLLFIRLSIQDDDVGCRIDNGGFILWVYISS